MYLRILCIVPWYRYAIYFGLFINWGFYLAAIIAALYFNCPAPGQSWQELAETARYRESFNMSIPIPVGSLILDVYILLLPIIPILRLQMSSQKKAGFIAVFTTGIM
jgi:hypothetical protein